MMESVLFCSQVFMLGVDPDLTYMIGKTEDMEYHVKDKFSEEVLLCGSFGDIVASSPSKMLVFV
mgnify:CR=1 FL=1